MSDMVAGNVLSWSNFFETLVIMAFICFAIGLYWRFKFRSRYLAMELEETRQLNEILRNSANAKQPLAAVPNTITLTGSTSETVTLQIGIDDGLLADAAVHLQSGKLFAVLWMLHKILMSF